MPVLVKDISAHLESIAPPGLQESYDNAGLIVGNPDAPVRGVLVCIDSTEAIIEEAIAAGANMVIAHHPIIFRGVKSLTGSNYIERAVILAIKNDIAIYAIHTNLDNILGGVNGIIADKLRLKNRKILKPLQGNLRKLITFCPVNDAGKVREALFLAGAGEIGRYDSCSFNTTGTGTYRAGEDTNPYKGEPGKLHVEEETRIEVVFPEYLNKSIVRALLRSHPYEEVAYDILKLENDNPHQGAGIVGDLEQPVGLLDFLASLKSVMGAGVVKYTAQIKPNIQRIAVCGGSGSFLLGDAISAQADVFITSDFKYHEFFDAENRIVIADIGHYESEQYTSDLIVTLLVEKFSTFAVLKSKTNTNPVQYL